MLVLVYILVFGENRYHILSSLFSSHSFSKSNTLSLSGSIKLSPFTAGGLHLMQKGICSQKLLLSLSTLLSLLFSSRPPWKTGKSKLTGEKMQYSFVQCIQYTIHLTCHHHHHPNKTQQSSLLYSISTVHAYFQLNVAGYVGTSDVSEFSKSI